ncbi:MAG: hypothetical protein E4H14_12450 [Candidatus Thorarchaeota archaeon]|nr:MAG: hypothetical protein E4H14_12450 [Candidatus Thorarchaeota archaeon]
MLRKNIVIISIALLAMIGGLIFIITPLPNVIQIHSTDDDDISAIEGVRVTFHTLLPQSSSNQTVNIDLTSSEGNFTLVLIEGLEETKMLDGLPFTTLANITSTHVNTSVSIDTPIEGWLVIYLVSYSGNLDVIGDISVAFLVPHYGYGIGLLAITVVLMAYILYKKR